MPGGHERDPYHHGDLRNALCRHALRTIENEGLAALSLRDAARALGVSPSAVYRHFEDKAALVAAVVGDGYARMTHAMETAARSAEQRGPAGHEARAALTAMGLSYVRFAAAHPSHFRAMLDAPPAAARAPRDLLGRAVDRALGTGLPPGERRAARRAAFAAIHGLAVLVATGHAGARDPSAHGARDPSAHDARDPSAHDEDAREVLAMVLRGLPRDGKIGASAKSAPAHAPATGSAVQRDGKIGVSAKEKSPATAPSSSDGSSPSGSSIRPPPPPPPPPLPARRPRLGST